MARIVLIGPAYPLRSGLATFNERLVRAFQEEGHSVVIYSFSLQYPSFLFPGKTQYSTEAPPENILIKSRINSINPFNWLETGRELKRQSPDLIVVRYWLPFMGACLGTILRRVRKNKHTRIIAITDNIIPHEKRPGDRLLTRYFLRSCDAFITMSEKVLQDLRSLEQTKPALLVTHPLYDNFGAPVDKQHARKQLGLPAEGNILLFFGFIRKYKGLDMLLEALALLKQFPVRLLVAGEFYEEEAPYREQIRRLGLEDKLILRTDFIPDSQVKYYFCAADVVIQPYRNATQSGVTPLAYHFEKPMIVTDTGGLPAMVPHEKAGLVCKPVPASIADAVIRFYETGEASFIPFLREEKKKYTWEKLTGNILKLANETGCDDLTRS